LSFASKERAPYAANMRRKGTNGAIGAVTAAPQKEGNIGIKEAAPDTYDAKHHFHVEKRGGAAKLTIFAGENKR